MSIHVIKSRSAILSEPTPNQNANSMIGLVFLHAVLALILSRIALFSTLHALLTISIGIYWALTARHPAKVFYICAYISGAEVLWRMTDATVFWEFGKYAITFLLGIVQLRFSNKWIKASLLYILLMSVSTILTFDRLGFSSLAREEISSNLSGPLALAVAILIFSQVALDFRQIRLLLWSCVAPIFGIFTLAIYSTLTDSSLNFTGESNFVTSGGFGPNQVSAILGLGALLSIMLTILEIKAILRGLALLLALGFLGQSLLTFSRGGFITAVICIIVLGIHTMQHTQLRRVFLPLILSLLLISTIIVPLLNGFTNGMMFNRWYETLFTNEGDWQFQDSHREEIANFDQQLFEENLLFGVGVGISKYERFWRTGFYAASHTELSRVLAEHGLVGLTALLFLLFSTSIIYRKRSSPIAKAWMATFIIWSLLTMMHAAMRTAAIPFMFGFAIIDLINTGD